MKVVSLAFVLSSFTYAVLPNGAYAAQNSSDNGIQAGMEQQVGTSWGYGSKNCMAYKCGTPFAAGRNCQCNLGCQEKGDCCHDYWAICNPPTPPPTPALPFPGLEGATPVIVNGLSVYGHPSASINYPKYEGFTLHLAEEFEEPMDLDADPIWTWSDGGLGVGIVRFIKEQIKFEDGKMKLYVSEDKVPPGTQACSHANKQHIWTKPLVGGEMRTRYNMFRYGRYETRLKAPEVQPGKPWVNGNFIATMFAYKDINAHHWREIDFELTGAHTNMFWTNELHADNYGHWEPWLSDSKKHWLSEDVNLRKDFHDYTFVWTPNELTWYIDGTAVRWGSKFEVPDLSMKVMFNLWVYKGKDFGGRNPENNRYPLVAEYEYFRFYKYDADTEYPCADMSTKCLKDDDKYLSANNPCDGIPNIGLLQGKVPCLAECKR